LVTVKPETFNIYCDESCHLENDHLPVMVLGAVWSPTAKSREVSHRIREIKEKHGLPPDYELKWERVSRGATRLYLELIDYFFDDDHLHFRAYVAHKVGLNHEGFDQSHEEWYYKMYFHLLSFLLDPECTYRIYIDIKDTRGGQKVDNLRRVLSNNMLDFEQRIIERIQIVESRHVEQVQLADLLSGAVSYANRGLDTNEAKVAVVQRIRQRSRYSLLRTTLIREQKFNIFHWHPRENENV
jgi:hypothetical protein